MRALGMNLAAAMLRSAFGRWLIKAVMPKPAKRADIIEHRHKETDMSDTQALFASMQQRFNPQAAQGMDAVFQFELTDADPYYIAIDDGRCEISEGEHDDPTVTLIMDSATLTGVMEGSIDGMQAFMTGKIKADGDIMLATKLTRLFPKSQG